MHHGTLWIAVMKLALAISLVIACSAERPGGDKPDAGMMGTELNAPMLDVPMSTPNPTVAVRGMTGGSRIVVKGGPGEPVVRSVLPTGGFCLDVPLMDSGPTQLLAYALKDGTISPAATFQVTRDAAAAIPPNPMCLGMEAPVCVPESASACTNMKDDDCNGFTDACDPSCNGCMDDALSPNWEPFYVPMIAPGTYNLKMCPCRTDWFAFQVTAGEVIHAHATFDSVAIDLDMKLQTVADAEGNAATSVASSQTTTGIEDITWTATTAGMYYLKVYAYDGDNKPYTLRIY